MAISTKSRNTMQSPMPVHKKVAEKETFDKAAETFGQQVLAPIMAEYLARLHATIMAAAADGVQALFCYRAGLRILHLYGNWLAARGEQLPNNVVTFKTSRIASLKASFATAPELAIMGIGTTLSGLDLHDVAFSLLEGKMKLAGGQRLSQIPLHDFITTEHEVAKQIRDHLNQQSRLMSAYLANLAGDSKRLLLIDSGWAGTSQLVLERAFPAYSFEGVYFGTVGRASILGHQPRTMHGLMFNTDDFGYDRNVPESVFALHRHMIESLLEPAIPSITSITKKDIRQTREMPAAKLLETPSCKWDAVFGTVLAGVVASAKMGPAARRAAYSAALGRLTEILLYPTPETTKVASGKFRSFDLGRDGGVEPLLSPNPRFDGDQAEYRIEDALWAAGQAALEYSDPAERRRVQESILARLSKSDASDHFVALRDASTATLSMDNTVTIITRTKNRPTLLRRAAESVAQQTFYNYEWVIVNDGGNLDDVLEVVNSSQVDPTKITICHNEQSLGMEGASNAGIASSSSTWIVIHDDDDSWHPDFLKTTTRFLDANRGIYQGVITGTVLINEEIVGETVVEHSRRPYQDWVKAVHLAEMATGNFFAPIAFVFNRAIYDIIGGFDPSLPVLGDWDFNLRFLLEGDIGVIEKPLAYYHHRNAAANSAYSNSVVGGIQKHLAYNSIVRNKYVREAVLHPKLAVLANLVSNGYLHLDTRARLDGVRSVAEGNKQLIGQPQKDVQKSEREMDERWVMMCALATQVAALSDAGISVDELIKKLQYAEPRALGEIHLAIPPDFNERAYLEEYPDINESVKSGGFRNGYTHYIFHGQHEGRKRPSN